ncbi:hypothetical protein HDK64DRAFT_339281 [Phyllosticta capitalensis]
MSRDWRELRKHHSPIGSFLRYCSCHGCKHVHEHQDHTDGEEADRPSSKYSAHDKRQAHQETATPDSAPSDSQEHLWDEAYQKLKSKQQDLVGGFEKMILEESGQDAGARLNEHTLGSVSIRPLLKTVSERKLAEMSDGQLPEPIKNTIRIVQESSGLITLAVKNCPEAALAWSVVTLSLTFLTRPGEVESSHRDGLAYVAARMEYFVAMESEVSKFPPPQQKMVSKSILELYSDVLEFQLHSVARLYRNRLKTFSRDLLDWDKWDEKLASLKQKESDVLRDAERIHRNLCRENLSKHHEELDRSFDQLLDFQKKQLEVYTQQLDVSTQHLNFVLSQDENECISSFARDYMGYKNDVSGRIPGTCQWFVDRPKFHKFLSESGPGLLLVTADPGCGKSVLSKHLIDSVLPEKTRAQVCYFFFKDGHSDSMSLNVALCSMIHQLLRAKPALVKHAMKPFKENGTELFKSDTDLRDILVNMATEENVVCVLDALDECKKNDLHNLCQFLDEPLKERKKPRLRFLMTSRPYDRITSEFHNQEDLRIPGEADETSGTIRQEISLVIQYKVKRLKDDLKLSDELAAEIEKRLFEVPHRTYLWVHLVFDDLSHETTSAESNSQNVYVQREHTIFKRTKKGIQERLQTLPTSLNQAYEKILSRAPEKDKERLRKAFCIILAARRPLTVLEMNIAMETTAKTCSWDDLDRERDEDFAQSLRNMAGLFISITGGKIYLIHQTAREFLQAEAQTTQYSRGEDSTWQNSIHMNEAHHTLAKITCRYLYVLAKTLETPETEIPVFQDYAAVEWNDHCLDALMGDGDSTRLDRFYQWVIGALHKSQAPSESQPHDFDIGLSEPHDLLDEILPPMVLVRYGPESFGTDVAPDQISGCLLQGNELERNMKKDIANGLGFTREYLTPFATSWIWKRAYEKLRKNEQDLVTGFEEIIREQSHAHESLDEEEETDERDVWFREGALMSTAAETLAKLEELGYPTQGICEPSFAANDAADIAYYLRKGLEGDFIGPWAFYQFCLSSLLGSSKADSTVYDGLTIIAPVLRKSGDLDHIHDLRNYAHRRCREALIEFFAAVLRFLLHGIHQFCGTGETVVKPLQKEDWNGLMSIIYEKEKCITSDALFDGLFEEYRGMVDKRGYSERAGIKS